MRMKSNARPRPRPERFQRPYANIKCSDALSLEEQRMGLRIEKLRKSVRARV